MPSIKQLNIALSGIQYASSAAVAARIAARKLGASVIADGIVECDECPAQVHINRARNFMWATEAECEAA